MVAPSVFRKILPATIAGPDKANCQASRTADKYHANDQDERNPNDAKCPSKLAEKRLRFAREKQNDPCDSKMPVVYSLNARMVIIYGGDL
jgi:hypothetical protein